MYVVKNVFCSCLCLDGTRHEGSVTCIGCHKDGTLIATGAEDSKSKIINSTTGKVCLHVFMKNISCLHETKSKVLSLGFGNS